MIDVCDREEGVSEGRLTGGAGVGREFGGVVAGGGAGETGGGESAKTVLNGQRTATNNNRLLAIKMIAVLRSGLGNLLLPGQPRAIIHHPFSIRTLKDPSTQK